MGYDASTRASVLQRDPAARAIVDRYVPGLFDSPMLRFLTNIRLGGVVSGALFAGETPPDLAPMWQQLAALPGSASDERIEPAPTAPSDDYEDASVAVGSARIQEIVGGEQWRPVEVVIHGPAHGNPFTDVDVHAVFVHETGETVRMGGFYDGDGVYRIRFAPPQAGRWSFHTASNARSLTGLSGQFGVGPAAGHGPVRVADTFHFRYEDGTRFHPIGTTLYAWTHQPADVREATLRTLAGAPFTKVRMCVMPKSYLYNEEEPELYPFTRDADGDWDFSRFDPAFFARLEEGVAALDALGVEADVILFHAYDRWGFSDMPAWADDHYLRYVVRRLSAFPNVWWSLANEYDLVASKTTRDWERFAAVIQSEDPVDHLRSIHNCFRFYDQTQPWITHASVQRIDVYRTAENTDLWRAEWRKPIVIDECGYEGDIDLGWGNLPAEELVRRAWEAAVRGGYLNHGETFVNSENRLWWSKGGELIGASPARFGFLLDLIGQAPGQIWEPLPSDWDARWAGSDDHRILYFGFSQPSYREVRLRPGTTWHVDVIDTWNMTVDTLPDTYRDHVRIDLPARPYMALRFRMTDSE